MANDYKNPIIEQSCNMNERKVFIVKKVLSKTVLESIVGEKAFLSGPHEMGINYNSAEEFGHYNPDFLTKLTETLTSVFSNKLFVDNTQALYNNQLKQ